MFETFSPDDAQAWTARIEKELKGKPFETLLRETYEGVVVEPFYAADKSREPLKLPERNPGWRVRQEYLIDAQRKPEAKLFKAAAAHDVSRFGFRLLEDADAGEIINALPENGECCFYVYHTENLAKISDKTGENNGPALDLYFNPFLNAAITGEAPERLLERASGFFSSLSVKNSGFALGVDGGLFQESGGSAAQELAYSFAAAVETVRKFEQFGWSQDETVRNLHFSFVANRDFFLEIAKLRAARALWTHIAGHFKLETASQPRMHARTSFWNASVKEPHTNLIRSTLAAASAVLGGADEVSVLPFDALSAPANLFSDRMARNIQHILREEAYFDRVADPARGSYYVETLSRELYVRAWEIFTETEELGGMSAALSSGKVQEEIARTRQKRAERIQNNQEIFIGVNKHAADEAKESDGLPWTPAPVANPEVQTLTFTRGPELADLANYTA